MTTAANNLWSAYGNRSASWVNTDVAIAVELHNLGMKTGRQELIDKGRYFIDDVLTSGRMFADGAVGYIGTQNESGGYQGTVESYVNRYYQITGRPQALEILQKMEWYGPINGRMIDWWTSPSWKHAWNFISGSGQTGESTNGKNPYTRASLDASIAAAATATNWAGSVSQVGWYETGTTALTRPDTYTVFDRNIQGPRSWQGGLWNTTGTLRAINDNESGHFTLMGAQVMDPDPNFRVNASVMGVFPRIRTATGGSRDTDGTFAEGRHAWLTSKLAGDSTVTSDFTAIGASHKIHVYGSSTKGTEHDWTARQVWLNLPDRTIGLLDLAPNANLSAYEVQGAIRLGYGGTAYSSTKTLVSTGTNAWSYGNLRIKLHDHNYAEVAPEQYAFRVTNAPITEITLRDQIGGGSNNTLNHLHRRHPLEIHHRSPAQHHHQRSHRHRTQPGRRTNRPRSAPSSQRPPLPRRVQPRQRRRRLHPGHQLVRRRPSPSQRPDQVPPGLGARSHRPAARHRPHQSGHGREHPRQGPHRHRGSPVDHEGGQHRRARPRFKLDRRPS